MNFSSLKRYFCIFFCYFYAVSVILIPSEAYAIYEGTRSSSYRSDDTCDTGLLSPDFFSSNKDVTWEMSNPFCILYMTTVGATMVGGGIAARFACRPNNTLGFPIQAGLEEILEADPDLPTLTPVTAKKVFYRSQRCSQRNAEVAQWGIITNAACNVPVPTPTCPTGITQTGIAVSDASRCCGAYAAYMVTVGAAIASLMAIYGAAKIAYDRAQICGTGWNKWRDIGGGKWVKGKGDYPKCLEKTFYNVQVDDVNCNQFSINPDTRITNPNYREFIYGGYEYEDKQGSCKNPWNSQDRIKYLGYDDDEMRFYMTGPGAAPVYACHRFLKKLRDPSSLQAYECCKQRSQNTVCIESHDGLRGTSSKHFVKFCELGSKCWVGPVQYEAYSSKVETNYACAKTFSVCPYNHLLGGGTEIKKMMDSDQNYMSNFCQYMKHCSKIPVLPFIRTSGLEGSYIASSCRDMQGDSQNIYGYESGLAPVRARGFAAPMAQCFKETLENVLLNTAGYTQCVDPDEAPGPGETCASGYVFRQGYNLNQESFLSKIRHGLQSSIKMMLVLSVVAFGVMILFAVPSAAIEKKKLLPYILKIGLVMYFALSDQWHQPFLKGILGTSTFLSSLVFDVEVPKDSLDGNGNVTVSRENERDGCQFPRYNYADSNEATRANNPSYPQGKEYLEIWDTLDCKVARALGFGPDVSVPNVLIMIVAGFFTGGLGILFVVGSFLFAFFLISMTVRALHIFLVSVIAIVLMIYVSPITISMSLFERTKGIFEGWKKQLMGFILQPMILFAYLGILITVFDHTIIGKDVRFEGDASKGMKRIVCNARAEQTSLYCIFRVSSVDTWRGLEVFGIGIPMLRHMTPAKMNNIIQAAIIMFVFANFMDKITYFAKNLVGGAEMSNGWNISTQKLASKARSIARGVQKRGMGAIKKHGSTVARKAYSLGKAGVRKTTSRGKDVAENRDTSTASRVDSGGGGAGGVGGSGNGSSPA